MGKIHTFDDPQVTELLVLIAYQPLKKFLHRGGEGECPGCGAYFRRGNPSENSNGHKDDFPVTSPPYWGLRDYGTEPMI